MLLKDIISIPESQLDATYSSLSKKERATLILIEDGSEEGKLLISYAKDDTSEEIPINHLGLYASSWNQKVIRIDSWRFKCLQETIYDGEIVRDTNKLFRNLVLMFRDDDRIDYIDNVLDNIRDIIKSLDDEVEGLFTINNEQDKELTSFQSCKCNQADELSHEPTFLNQISILKIQEPILAESLV